MLIWLLAVLKEEAFMFASTYLPKCTGGGGWVAAVACSVSE